MIGELFDKALSVVAPSLAYRRMQSRAAIRRYNGASTHRLNSHRRPRNQSADAELRGPWGADDLRAWARMLVRDNSYAWGVVDTIVSSVIGCGIQSESAVELVDGSDDELTNDARNSVWEEWCKVCDVKGELHFHEMQALAVREMVEAGECLIHVFNVPQEFRGISRPVPLALEMIEADRLDSTKTTYHHSDGGRIERGIQYDQDDNITGYWILPSHPSTPTSKGNVSEFYTARDIIHLFRKDRIGQNRGVSWFAPAIQVLRDLGIFVENELQASAVASCYTAAVKTTTPHSPPSLEGGGMPSTGTASDTDADGNRYEYMQPGQIMYLLPEESIEFGSPGRPNSDSEPWISLMLRGIAVGTGLSYETVARDYSKTTYSANRASQLEDRRRFRRWQDYVICHMCQPVRSRFFDAAATAGLESFPTATELLMSESQSAPVDYLPTGWEWVDPKNEQVAGENAVRTYQSTYQEENAKRGKGWRRTMRQRKKEERFREGLGLPDPYANPAPELSELEEEGDNISDAEETVQTDLEASENEQEEQQKETAVA